MLFSRKEHADHSMGRINKENIRKTIYYLKRNGVVNTWNAAKERMEEGREILYHYEAPDAQELERQRSEAGYARQTSRKSQLYCGTISIVVPAFRTQGAFLRELIASVQAQTYPYWELIIADASDDDSVENVVKGYSDERIKYIRLEENKGIAENTNRGLEHAGGEYIGLLDHDDVLTPDALYEMALQIAEGGTIFYSDEDKCNEDQTCYYEPNLKEKFNLDLLLSNNYICHFLVMESSLIKELRLRAEYDGAQDYDLILRAAERFLQNEEEIVHIPKVLYHWRCHTASTAANPQSKEYAYEAGKRAVQDFVERNGWDAEVQHMKHLGFYQMSYPAGPLHNRPDLGAVGGRILTKGKITGGRMTENGTILYEGLPSAYSGYLHRAVLAQDAEAVDIRCIRVREECIPIFEEITGVTYIEIPGTAIFDATTLPEDIDYCKVSARLGGAIREAGYRILYQPSMTVKR